MIYNIILFMLFVIILYIILYYENNKELYYHNNNILYFRAITISKTRYKKRVIYIINPTAGLANTLRGMSSTIYLSFIYNTSFFLGGWKSIVYYFDFPDELISRKYIKSNFSFQKFNKSILSILSLKEVIVKITDIHGFMDFLFYNSNSYHKLRLLKRIYKISKLSKRKINSIIYREIFIPSQNVLYYYNIFDSKRNNKKVLGIHVRSGIFSNNFTESYFSRKIALNIYFDKAQQLIKNNNLSYVFALSDNEKYLCKLKYHFHKYLIEIPFKGDIVHSRFSLYNPVINNNAIRIVSEFIILSNCDFIIGTSRSSFSAESCNRLMKCCNII